MDNILQVPCIKEKNVQCNNDEETAILNYGKSFLSAFNSQVMKFSKNGGAITSCICHGCNWDTIKINGVLTYKHYINWHNGNSGKDTFHKSMIHYNTATATYHYYYQLSKHL